MVIVFVLALCVLALWLLKKLGGIVITEETAMGLPPSANLSTMPVRPTLVDATIENLELPAAGREVFSTELLAGHVYQLKVRGTYLYHKKEGWGSSIAERSGDAAYTTDDMGNYT